MQERSHMTAIKQPELIEKCTRAVRVRRKKSEAQG